MIAKALEIDNILVKITKIESDMAYTPFRYIEAEIIGDSNITPKTVSLLISSCDPMRDKLQIMDIWECSILLSCIELDASPFCSAHTWKFKKRIGCMEEVL